MNKTKEKLCYKCNGTEQLFAIKAHKGRYTYRLCKPCNSADVKRYAEKGKKIVFDHYGSLCACCSEDTVEFLSIDHVDNDSSMDKWPNGKRITGVHLYNRIRKAGFPDTYQILCMNCNFGKRMNGGVCPHLAK